VSDTFVAKVAAYYDGKTEAIIRRYGPGPRVHFHTGLVRAGSRVPHRSGEIRSAIFAAQERILERAAVLWNASSTFGGRVLDAGCGLGGGALFWAQNYGAHVTAVTITSSHVDHVRQFAAWAGVADQITAIASNIVDFQFPEPFDTVVAFESSCYFHPRRQWMRRMFALLPPRALLCIADCFLGREEYRRPVDSYWRTRLGTVEDYVELAARVGFELACFEDVSAEVVGFWDLTTAAIKRELLAGDADQRRYRRSLEEHHRLRRGFADGGLRYALFAFRRPGSPLNSGEDK
jgi:SAM-dependent methyltransferase